MEKRLVLTLTGNDRIGIVDDVTKIVLTHLGNVESSRMARLGGEFAMLMLVSVPNAQHQNLDAALDGMRHQGFELSIRPTAHLGRRSGVLRISQPDPADSSSPRPRTLRRPYTPRRKA